MAATAAEVAERVHDFDASYAADNAAVLAMCAAALRQHTESYFGTVFVDAMAYWVLWKLTAATAASGATGAGPIMSHRTMAESVTYAQLPSSAGAAAPSLESAAWYKAYDDLKKSQAHTYVI